METRGCRARRERRQRVDRHHLETGNGMNYQERKKINKMASLKVFEDQIKASIDECNTNLMQTFQDIEGKDVVAVLGNTGSGKSTLLNFIAGKQLGIDDTGYVLMDKDGFKIGAGDTSQTMFPQTMNCEAVFDGKPYVLVDLPGLMDTRGEGINFINASTITHILTKSASVRLLFVESYSSFTAARAANFKRLVKNTEKLMKDKNVLVSSSCLVITMSLEEDPSTLLNSILDKTENFHCREWVDALSTFNDGSKMIAPFMHTKMFFNIRRSTGEPTMNEKEHKEHLKDFAKDLASLFEKMEPIHLRPQDINASQMMEEGTVSLVYGLTEQIVSNHHKEIEQKFGRIENMNKEELERLSQELSNFNYDLNDVLGQNEIMMFLRAFDEGMYEDVLENGRMHLEQILEKNKEVINSRLAILNIKNELDTNKNLSKQQIIDLTASMQAMKIDHEATLTKAEKDKESLRNQFEKQSDSRQKEMAMLHGHISSLNREIARLNARLNDSDSGGI